MWAGIDIDSLRKSIYGNFYSPSDYALIMGAEDAALSDVKKLINKARKIGDSVTESLLLEMYDELLYRPSNYPSLPPRSVLLQRYYEIIQQTEAQLKSERATR